MGKHRSRQRHLRIWNSDYLVNKYLWPNVERAIRDAKDSVATSCPLVLDVGCGHKPYRECFGPVQYLGMDRTSEDSSPDFLGDACHIPIRTETMDIVFATQVIEHVPKPQEMLKELKRVLKPKGILILSGPMFWPLHEEPYDFYRFTKYGFARLLGDVGFSRWEIREDGGDWAQVALALCLKLDSLPAVPLRCLVNVIGGALDAVNHSNKSPANYTVFAESQ
jgi:SAM-dependent methyltransferase